MLGVCQEIDVQRHEGGEGDLCACRDGQKKEGYKHGRPINNAHDEVLAHNGHSDFNYQRISQDIFMRKTSLRVNKHDKKSFYC